MPRTLEFPVSFLIPPSLSQVETPEQYRFVFRLLERHLSLMLQKTGT